MMKRRLGETIHVALATVMGVSLMVMGAVAGADDNDDEQFPITKVFTDRSIKGIWGFSGDGFVSGGLPGVTIGILAFDGKGGCKVSSNTVNINGTLFGPLDSDTCSYSVKPDGTGTSTAEFSVGPDPGPVTIAFVIVDRRKELRFIRTDDVVVHFTARRQ